MKKPVPARRKGEMTRERLLDASVKLFAEKQFHGTRISDIVKAAGVTQPSFYSYFQSKEELYSLLIAQFDEELEELVASMLIDASLPRENVLENITVSFRRYLDFFSSQQRADYDQSFSAASGSRDAEKNCSAG
ncbi:TetR/AcrR family transcriptional regulator [Pantoea tagorei]